MACSCFPFTVLCVALTRHPMQRVHVCKWFSLLVISPASSQQHSSRCIICQRSQIQESACAENASESATHWHGQIHLSPVWRYKTFRVSQLDLRSFYTKTRKQSPYFGMIQKVARGYERLCERTLDLKWWLDCHTGTWSYINRHHAIYTPRYSCRCLRELVTNINCGSKKNSPCTLFRSWSDRIDVLTTLPKVRLCEASETLQVGPTFWSRVK